MSSPLSQSHRLNSLIRAFILFTCALTLSAVLTPPPGVAAPAITITALSADIWPEHDDPRILIIYRGTLSADASLPFPLSFSIPAGAQVHAAAHRRNGQLFSAQYQASRDGDQAKVTFLVPVQDFQFEYYADAISGKEQRAFAVGLIFPLLVARLQVSVEQPLRSTGFALTPTSARTATSGGFTYYLYTEEQWPAGKVWSVRGTYRKEDNNPSLLRAAPQPAAAPPGQLAGGGGPLLWFLWAVIGMVIGVAGTLTVTYFRRPRAPRRAAAPSPRRRARPAPRGQEPADARHCANCGTRAAPGDRFCRNCGQLLPRT